MKTRFIYSISALLIVIFASSLFLMAQGKSPSSRDVIHLRTGTIDTSQEAPDITSALNLMGLSQEDPAYYIVQFNGPIENDWKSRVEDAGGVFFGYIPHFAFIVKMDGRTKTTIQAMEFVRWIGLYRPEYKIDPNLTATYSEAEPSQPITLIIVTFKGEDVRKVADRIEQLGGTILTISESEWKGKIKVQIESSRITEIGTIPGVNWVEPAPVYRLFNNESTDIMNARNVWNTYGLHGTGQTVAVADSGLDQGSPNAGIMLHDDFEDGAGGTRVIQLIDRVGDGADDVKSGHGTHVAGSVLGNGLRSGSNPLTSTYPSGCYAGIAPEASLVLQAVENNQTGGLDGIPDDLNELFDQARGAGANIHTNSWGYYGSAGFYLSDSQEVDEFMWTHKDFLILFAAGNDGTDGDSDGFVDLGSVSAPSTAKNCISVGATEGNRPPASIPPPVKNLTWGDHFVGYPADPINSDLISDNIDGMAAFSSRGPTHDMRFKPDVVAPGVNIISARSLMALPTSWGDVDANYRWMGGTSMATPLVAGACALIRQYYTDIQGITTPSAALIKATLINGATDIPGQYPAPDDEIIDSPRPNYAEGWGRVNVANSIFPTPPRVLEYLDETSSFTSTGERRGITFQNNSAVPLAVTLVWTDYPSTPTAFFNLVNDLDIILTDPGGATHYPNGFGTSEGINTVEVIDIPVAQVGQYTVIVQAYNIPQGPQPFAVVACGDIASWAVHYPPNGPTDLVATAVSSSQVNLSWTDNATDENGFKIERKTGDGGAYSPIDMVPADVISYSDTTVSPGQLYYYRVCAYNVYGDSSSSNEAAAVTPGGHFGLTGSDSGGGGCFIATAAYGSPDGSCIDLLRAFRDKYLVANYIGKKWVDLYYRYSPIMAGFIADHPAMRKGVRLILFPFVAFSAGMVHTTALQKGLIFCPILGLLLGMVVLSKRRTFNRHVLKR